MRQNENEKIDYLNIHKNYLLCNICKQMLKEPCLCIYCEKLFCFNCIKKKYEKTKLYECQYCKTKINYDEYLPFIRYIDILYFFGINIPNNNNYESKCNENNDMNNGLNNYDFYEDSINYYYCEEHNSEIIYYCVDCNKKLCGLCISPYNYEEQDKNNINHENHNVYKIKDLKKKKLMGLIEEYQQIIQQNNQYQINIYSFNKRISYFKHLKKIIQNSANEIEKISNENCSSIKTLISNIRAKLSSSKNKFENELPFLNVSLQNIIDRKQLEGYKDLIRNIEEKAKKINSDDSIEIFDKILNEKPKHIIYESVSSKKIILKNLNENEEILIESNLIMSNGIYFQYKIVKIKPNEVKFIIKIKKENDFDDSKYNVSILIKEYNKNEYKSIFLKEFNKKVDNNFFIFYELISLMNFYCSDNINGDIKLRIVLSRIKIGK